MAENSKDLSNIDFDNDWKCYCQESNNKTNEKTILSNASTDQDWSPIELPHIINTSQSINNSYKWWYCKQFDWTSIDQQSKEQIYLDFESSDIQDNKSEISATIWLNNTEIFSDSISLLKHPIELPSELLHSENKHGNMLVICCVNTSLSLHVCLLIQAKIIYATGQVMSDERSLDISQDSDKQKNNVLDYTVSVDDADGRIDVKFNPKLKSKSLSTQLSTLKQPSQSIIDENQSTENIDEDLLVPRLAIVILIVGTRGDVQPFIALGQALRAVGHRVRIATHETFRSFVRGNGLEFYPLAGDPADLMSFMVKNSGIIPSMSSIIEGDVSKKRRSLADILASTWLACISDDDETKASFTAEAIIANPPSFGHVHCAEKLQIPLHIMFTMPWSPTTAFPHPLAKIDSSIGPKGKINLYSYDVIEMLTWTGMRDITNNFRKKTLGLRELHTRQATNILTDECVPHTYCWSPSLVAKPSDWGAHIDVSGFFFLNLGTAYTNPPKDLLEFLCINDDGSYKNPKLPPPIYVGFGSITGHDSRRILKVVVDAVNLTGYRVLLSGLATDTDQLPSNIFRIGNVPHDWLFQYVSAVCHHGGAGTTAAGLRAGRPTIIVPFFGDQFFWGNVIEKSGAGSRPLPGKSITADQLADAFRFVHESTTCTAAERIRDAILKEDGCAAAVYSFHANLPLTHMHSDLEPTFAACYRLDKYNIQISRPVAQVLVVAGAIEESELRPHITREWKFEHDNRFHLPGHGIIEHSEKAITSMFTDTADELKRAVNNNSATKGTLESVGTVAKGVGLGISHLTIGCLSLYGEITDTLNVMTSLYDPYSAPENRQRPRVTDFKSGAKAASLALINGWKDGFTGIVTQPRAGYERHGALGSVAGSLIATANIAVKPTVGTLSSVTYLSRGAYASVRKTIETYRNEGRHISSKLFDTSSSNEGDESLQKNNDDEEISTIIKTAATRSGYHPKVCQHIIQEFEKIKQEQSTNPSINKRKGISDLVSKK
ncbi:unnamed protein product [Adineta steineri]|uniref:Sterol 3-beta-glucosyltransferase n=1 Tax=Adineta steineri TaxID=433720 RepID=A0A814B954_9BILA|nr:unnamed protein product [Adineta steineri]CAF1106132.1 unnamed protein product [Adineta steineri]CAF1208818.1 unnamed protein product [Adineta steineri]